MRLADGQLGIRRESGLEDETGNERRRGDLDGVYYLGDIDAKYSGCLNEAVDRIIFGI